MQGSCLREEAERVNASVVYYLLRAKVDEFY